MDMYLFVTLIAFGLSFVSWHQMWVVATAPTETKLQEWQKLVVMACANIIFIVGVLYAFNS